MKKSVLFYIMLVETLPGFRFGACAEPAEGAGALSAEFGTGFASSKVV